MKEKLKKNMPWVLVGLLVVSVIGTTLDYRLSTAVVEPVNTSSETTVQSNHETAILDKDEPKVKRPKPIKKVESENKPQELEVVPEKPTKYKEQTVLDGDEPLEYLETLSEFHKISKEFDR